MGRQSDGATRMREFAGKICIFPTRQGADAYFLWNSHTAQTDSAGRVGVPVRSVFQVCIGCWPGVFCECTHDQFPSIDHEHQGRVGIHLAIQLFRFGISVAEKHEPRLRPAPPGDQLWGSCQHMFRQNFRRHACPQTFGERLKKPCRDRLPSTQVRRLVRSELYFVQRGKGPAALPIEEHRLLQTEDSVVTDPQVDVHDCSSRVITPSSLPGIRSIRRLAAASVSHATASVRKPCRTLLGSESWRGMMRFGWGVVSIAVWASSSKHPTTASPDENAASRHGSGGSVSISCSPMSSVNSGRLACREMEHSSSKLLTSTRTSLFRIPWFRSFRPRRLRDGSLRHCGVHPSM